MKAIFILLAIHMSAFSVSAKTFTCRSPHAQFGDVAISIDTGVGTKGFMGKVIVRNCGIAQEIAKHFGLGSSDKFDTLNLRPITMDFKIDSEPEGSGETMVVSCRINPDDYSFGELGKPLSLHDPLGKELPLRYPPADIKIVALDDETNILDIRLAHEGADDFGISVDSLKLECEDGNTIGENEGVCE